MDEQTAKLYNVVMARLKQELAACHVDSTSDKHHIVSREKVFEIKMWVDVKDLLILLYFENLDNEYKALMDLLVKLDCGWDLVSYAGKYPDKSPTWFKAIIEAQDSNWEPINVKEFDPLIKRKKMKDYKSFLKCYYGNVALCGDYARQQLTCGDSDNYDIYKPKYIVGCASTVQDVYEFSRSMGEECDIIFSIKDIDDVVCEYCSPDTQVYYNGIAWYAYLETLKHIIRNRTWTINALNL